MTSRVVKRHGRLVADYNENHWNGVQQKLCNLHHPKERMCRLQALSEQNIA